MPISTRRDAEIALVSARHDVFVAQAALLRQLGLLEPRALLRDAPLDDAVTYLNKAERRAAGPADALVRDLDALQGQTVKQKPLEQPPLSATPPAIIAAPALVATPVPIISHFRPEVPVPGTTGRTCPPSQSGPTMTPESATLLSDAETGPIALAQMLAIHRIAVDPAQLRHALGHTANRCRMICGGWRAREGGVKAKAIRTGFDKLERTPLPALANGPKGWFLIGRVSGEEALVQIPARAGADASGPARGTPASPN